VESARGRRSKAGDPAILNARGMASEVSARDMPGRWTND
jgi:hypothetical protein